MLDRSPTTQVPFISAIALFGAGCPLNAPLQQTAEGDYQVDHHAYAIAPLPGGALMPTGWVVASLPNGDETVSLLSYSNSIAAFDAGLKDAKQLAERIFFK